MLPLLVCSCGGEMDVGVFVPPVVDGCEGLPHNACAIVETDCQAGILALTACLRGSVAPPMPAVEMLTTEEFRAMPESRVENDHHPEGAVLVDEEQLGAWMLFAMLAQRETQAPLDYARAWRADRLFVYRQGTDPAYVWQLELSTSSHALRIERDLPRKGTFGVIRRDATLYVIAAAADRDVWVDRVEAAFGL